MDELLATLLEAIKQLQEKDTLIEEELKGFEDEYANDKKLIDKQLVDLFGQIDRLIKEEVAKIPTPKDGKDFDRDMAVGLIRKEFKKLLDQKDQDIKSLKTSLEANLKALVQDIKPIGPDDRTVEKAVDQWAKDNKKQIIGPQGPVGPKGKDADQVDYQEINNTIKELFATLPKPQDGQDGVGIEDIEEDKGDIVITLTDGEVKRIKLPTKTITKNVGGGGAIRYKSTVNTRSINTDFEPTKETIHYFCDCTNGTINISLPKASSCVTDNESIQISFTKTDKTTGKVKIIPYGTDLILGSSHLLLESFSDTINIITDKNNWYLRS